MRTSTSSTRIAALLAFAVSTAPAAAQRTPGAALDSVPRALAEALIARPVGMLEMMRMMGEPAGRPRIIVGTLPSGLAQRLWLPPGATVLGGSESSGGGIAIIRSSLSKESLTAGYLREQLALGWSRPPQQRMRPSWGFVPAPGSESDPEQVLVFCSGGTVLSIGIEPVAGAQEITAQAAAVGEMVCRPPRNDPPEMGFPRNHPTLLNPPGTGDGLRVRCADWYSSGGGGSTRLSTTMSLDLVLAHYGRQLADSGWSRADDQLIMSRVWTRRDSTGALVELTLTGRNRSVAPSCVEVEMRVNTGRRD